MTSKWHKQYCELDMLDRDRILDQIFDYGKQSPYYADIYTSLVYEYPLTTGQIDSIIDRFNSGKDDRKVKRLIEKLERLRSQS